MSPLLVVTSFDQSMSLSDLSLIRPPPLMLHCAGDSRRKMDIITNHEILRIQVSDLWSELRNFGVLLFSFLIVDKYVYNKSCPPEICLIQTDNHTHTTSFPMPYLPLSSKLWQYRARKMPAVTYKNIVLAGSIQSILDFPFQAYRHSTRETRNP